jgi:hypothetical protein
MVVLMGSKLTNILLRNRIRNIVFGLSLALTFGSALLFSSSVEAAISIQETPPKYLILSSFKRNKKIWGTYNQIQETGFKLNNDGKRVKKNRVRNPIANIIFKEGKIFFIRPTQKTNAISIEVLGLPYKKLRKRTYKLFTKGHSEKLYAIFEEHIQSIIRKGLYKKENILEITINDVIFKDAICSRKKRVYKCQFPIELRNGENFKIPIVPKDFNKMDMVEDFTDRFKELRFLKAIKDSSLFLQYQRRLKRRLWKRVPSSNNPL